MRCNHGGELGEGDLGLSVLFHATSCESLFYFLKKLKQINRKKNQHNKLPRRKNILHCTSCPGRKDHIQQNTMHTAQGEKRAGEPEAGGLGGAWGAPPQRAMG